MDILYLERADSARMDRISLGDDVLFYYNATKKWLVRIRADGEFHTHLGVIRHAKAIGKKYGTRLVTNKEKYVYMLRPTMHDHVMKLQHGTQIVYPKDLGYIAARSGLAGGQTVVEIGTGSGALTIFAASIVMPTGHVYSFDVDRSFVEIARGNIARAGVSEFVTLRILDIKTTKRVPISGADLAVVDLGDPWTVIPQVRRMLRDSGSLFAICPTFNQLERLVAELVQSEFTDIESSEHILRPIAAREGKTRHAFQAIGHTTYLCHARKAHFGRSSSRVERIGAKKT